MFMTHFSIVIVGLALAATLQSKASKLPAGTEALQGTWMITSINGQAMPAEGPEMTLTFSGEKYHQAVGGKVNERGTIKVDAAKKPMTIDLLIAEGDDAGKIQLGIIEVAGDQMRASLDTPNAKQRPTDLNPKEGAITFVGKRQKP
jgi:uncharacterized protein (TIGR03067 family)